MGVTHDDLQRLLPDAAIEEIGNGELVIYTGLRVDPDDPDHQRLVGYEP